MSVDPNFDLPLAASDDGGWLRSPLALPGEMETSRVAHSNSSSALVPPPMAVPLVQAPERLPKHLAPPPPRPKSGFASAFQGVNAWFGAIIQRITLPEDDAPIDPFGKLMATTPPWFISLIVHFSMMIMLGLAVLGAQSIANREEHHIEMDLGEVKDNEIWAESIGEQLEDPSIKMSSEGLEPAKDAIAALATSDLPTVSDPLIGPPVLEPTASGNLPVGTVATPNIGLEFSGREEGTKRALLKAYGGTALTEDAVKLGLGWLARQQRSRGMWNLTGPYQDASRIANDEAATAMALIAFQGAGYTPDSTGNDGFTNNCARGWNWLLKSQQEDGHFFANMIPEQHQLYTQALCTIALCELYGMTRDEKYHDAAQKAVDYCVKTQASEGGWRYQPGVDSDLSVTGWFSMALQSARMAGIEVPSSSFDALSRFLDSVQRDEGARYAYQLQAGATLPLSAEGLLCRQYLGWERGDDRLRNGVEYLLANLPAWDKRNVYYWYYATQVCHHMEGSDWVKWNSVMRQLLPEHQVKRGAERGSWDPTDDRWGDAGGRLYVTCLSLYTLEVYYRHLPIYRHKMAGK